MECILKPQSFCPHIHSSRCLSQALRLPLMSWLSVYLHQALQKILERHKFGLARHSRICSFANSASPEQCSISLFIKDTKALCVHNHRLGVVADRRVCYQIWSGVPDRRKAGVHSMFKRVLTKNAAKLVRAVLEYLQQVSVKKNSIKKTQSHSSSPHESSPKSGEGVSAWILRSQQSKYCGRNLGFLAIPNFFKLAISSRIAE